MKKENQQNSKKITIDSIINDALKNLKEIVDVNTVIGKEVVMKDGTIIIPISKICVGFVAGGGELNSNYKNPPESYPFAGGSGAGFTVVPVGFLTGKNGNLNFINTKSDNSYDSLLNLTNKALKLIIENIKDNKKEK